MSEKAAKSKDSVKLDVETILQTAEGRVFINQLNTVSHVLAMRDSEIEFKGEDMVKTGYVSDYKSVQLFKCPKGYFLFFDKAFGKNNFSFIAETMDELLSKISDADVKQKLMEETAAVSEA